MYITDYFNKIYINQDIKQYLQRRLTSYNILHFAYFVLHKNSSLEFSLITNYPDEWVRLYQHSHLHLIDPIILVSKKRVTPFAWDDNEVISHKSANTAVFKLAKKYHITHGYTFVLHDYLDNLVILNLVADRNQITSFDTLVTAHKDKLQLLLVQAHDKMLMLYQQQPASQGTQATTPLKAMISLRENEILYWASLGKTYYEIAIILGIKKSTVKFHISNIIKKLGVINAKHAIRLGLELKLITPV